MKARLAGGVLLALGVGLLLLVFYQAFLAYSSLTAADFEKPAPLTIPTPVGELQAELPGLGAVPKILKVFADSIYFGVMIAAASKIAGKGIDLLRKL